MNKEETKASTTIDCFPQLSYANETDRALYFMQCNPLRDLHAKICHEEVPVCTLLNETRIFCAAFEESDRIGVAITNTAKKRPSKWKRVKRQKQSDLHFDLPICI